jgi:hypothetical protein
MNQPSSSKGHDKKRKRDHILNAVERPHRQKEYRPRLGKFDYVFSGLDSYEPKRKQKLTAQEVLAIGPTTAEYLRWSEVPITFD